MLYEFAIEPEVLHKVARQKRDCSDFKKSFTIGEPNVISGYPIFKRFRSKVNETRPKDMSDFDHSRLDSLLDFIQDNPRVARNGEYCRSRPWVENVRTEGCRVPFDHVLTISSYSKSNNCALDDFFCGTPNYPRGITVKRIADKMGSALRNLLRISTRIVLVDPFFRHRPSSWKPLVQYLNHSLDRKPSPLKKVDVLYNFGEKSTPQSAFLATTFRQDYPELARKTNLCFKCIREIGVEKIHNRYALTELGGVILGMGHSQGTSNEQQSHKDDINLLPEGQYHERWEQYAQLTAFELVEESRV